MASEEFLAKTAFTPLKNEIEKARDDAENHAQSLTSFTDVNGDSFDKGSRGWAEDAEDFSDISIGSANFKGDWSDLSGALNVPATVRHDDTIWLLINDLADVTTSEPSEANSDWDSLNITRLTTSIPINVDSISGLVDLNTDIYTKSVVSGFYSDTPWGFTRLFEWDSTQDQSNHDGWSIINPDHLSTIGSSGWYSSVGDGTDDTGTGCWVRDVENSVNVLEVGMKRGASNDTANDAPLTAVFEDMGGEEIVFPPGDAFYTSGRYTIPDNTVLKMYSQLRYTGTDNAPFLEQGSGSDQIVNGSIYNINTTNRSDYSSEDHIGLKLIGVVSSTFEVKEIRDFHTNLHCEGKFSYNTIILNKIFNGKYGVLINATTNFIAETLILGGHFSFTNGSTYPSVERYGIVVDKSSYGGGGNNISCLKQSFEIFNDVSADGSACYWVTDFEYLWARDFRFEASGATGDIYAARVSGDSHNNIFEVGRGTDSLLDETTAANNVVIGQQARVKKNMSLAYKISNIGRYVCDRSGSGDQSNWMITGGLSGFFRTVDEPRNIIGPSMRFNGKGVITGPSRYFGVLLDIKEPTDFIVDIVWDGDAAWGRLGVRLYDVDGNIISDSSAISARSGSGIPFNATQNLFFSNSNRDSKTQAFKIQSSTVKRAFIGFSAIDDLETFITGFSVYTDKQVELSRNFSENDGFFASEIPDHGYYKVGDTIVNESASTTGDPLQWVCINEGGRYNSARSNSLDLSGDNDLGSCYQFSDSSIWSLCTRGTTDSSEPDITGTDIGDIVTDGTAKWVKIADQTAEFADLGSY